MDSNERRRGNGNRPAAQRRRTGTPRQEREHPVRRRTSPRRKDPDAEIVYTPPVPFNRGRFVLRLATVVAVVLALLFGMSIFFKVENVTVSGNQKYTAWDISQAAGIAEDENLMTLSKARVSGNIISQLPYVKSVRIGIKLPDTVNIEITELDVTYAISDVSGGWWLMNDQGRIVDVTNTVTAKEFTQVQGVTIQVPTVGEQAVAKEADVTVTVPSDSTDPTDPPSVTMPPDTETEPDTTVPSGNQIDTISGAERLQAALAVLQQLSEDGFASKVASVDVTNLSALKLGYEDRFQVNLGDTSRMDYKISCLKAAIGEMAAYASGELDVSFTTWPDQIGYTPA